MTREQINSVMSELAQALDCEYAYSVFSSGKRSRFLIFYYPESDDLYADGKNYQSIEALTIEFYSPSREFESEETIKQILTSYSLAFSVISAYIPGEKVHMTTFNTEVMINGQ